MIFPIYYCSFSCNLARGHKTGYNNNIFHLNPYHSLSVVFLVQPTAPGPTVNLIALFPIPSLQTCRQRFSTSPQTPDSFRSIFHIIIRVYTRSIYFVQYILRIYMHIHIIYIYLVYTSACCRLGFGVPRRKQTRCVRCNRPSIVFCCVLLAASYNRCIASSPS